VEKFHTVSTHSPFLFLINISCTALIISAVSLYGMFWHARCTIILRINENNSYKFKNNKIMRKLFFAALAATMMVSVSNAFAGYGSSAQAPVPLQDTPDSVATPVVPADSSSVSDSTAQKAPAAIVLQ